MPIFGKKSEKEKEEEFRKERIEAKKKKEQKTKSEIKKEKALERDYNARMKEYMGESIGLLSVRIEEKERGKFEEKGFKLEHEERKINIENNTNSPMFSIEIFIEDKGFSKINNEDLFIPILGPKDSANSIKVIEYKVDNKRYIPPIKFSYDVEFPEEVKNPVFLYGKNNYITLTLDIENVHDTPLTLAYNLKGTEEFKEVKLLEENSVEYEELREGGIISKIVLRELLDRKKIGLNINVVPEISEYISVGDGFIKAVLNTALSRLKIKDVVMKTRLKHAIKKYERKEQPGVWDIEVQLENPNDFPIYVNGSVSLQEGEIVPDETRFNIENIVVEGNTVAIRDLHIAAGETISIKPIVVKSKIYPMFNSNLRGEVKEKISIKSVAQYDLEPLKYPILKGDIQKKMNIVVDEVYRDIVGENEIPSIGDSCIQVETIFVNTGSAEVGYIRLIEGIPPGLSNPKNIKLFINEEEIPEESYSTFIEPSEGDASTQRQLVIELRNLEAIEKIMRNGETLKLTYETCSEVPVSGTFNMPTSVIFSTDPENIKLDTMLPEEITPKITIKPIVRSLEVFQDLITIPDKEDVYKVVIKLRNTSDTLIRKYKIYDLIPRETFEILETKPEGKLEELEDKYKIEWVIEEIQPNEEIEITYLVKGKGAYRVDDLIGIEGVWGN